MSQSAQDDRPAILIFVVEIFGNHRKSSEVLGRLWKSSENFEKLLLSA